MASGQVGADFDPLRDAQFSWYDTMKYFYYYLQNEFADYALVVQISYFMAVACAVSITVVFAFMMVMFLKRYRSNRYHRKIDKRYAQAIADMVASPTSLTTEEVDRRIGRRQRVRRLWQYREWVKLVSEIFTAHRLTLDPNDGKAIELAFSNLHRLLDLLSLGPLIERMLREGLNADRVYLVQIAQQFQLSLSEGVILRMANIKNVALSKVVQTYYMWASNENPFRFLDEGGDGHYLPEDAIWVHNSMKTRSIEGRPLPSLLPFVLRAKYPPLKAMLIREVGYWGSDKDLAHLTDFFTDPNDDVRRASFEAVSRGRYAPAWEKMRETYEQQSESLKRAVLRSMAGLSDDRSPRFMEGICKTTPSGQTMRLALKLMWDMGPEGKEAFERVRRWDDDPSRQEIYQQIKVEAEMLQQTETPAPAADRA